MCTCTFKLRVQTVNFSEQDRSDLSPIEWLKPHLSPFWSLNVPIWGNYVKNNCFYKTLPFSFPFFSFFHSGGGREGKWRGRRRRGAPSLAMRFNLNIFHQYFYSRPKKWDYFEIRQFWKIRNFWLSISKRKKLKHNGFIPDLVGAIPLVNDNDKKYIVNCRPTENTSL